MAEFVHDRIENIVEKEKNSGYQHFFPFPTIFFKMSLFMVIKPGIVWLRFKQINFLADSNELLCPHSSVSCVSVGL